MACLSGVACTDGRSSLTSSGSGSHDRIILKVPVPEHRTRQRNRTVVRFILCARRTFRVKTAEFDSSPARVSRSESVIWTAAMRVQGGYVNVRSVISLPPLRRPVRLKLPLDG
jgi:hypothetical protein